MAARTGGTFTRRDAVQAGYTEREIKTLTGHDGGWVVLRRGVYVERSFHDDCSDDERYVLQVRAVGRLLTKAAVISHTSAAALHGLPMRNRWRELVHVTRPGVRGGRGESGVAHHRSELRPGSVVELGGLTVTGLARTGLDIGRSFGFEDGVVAIDAALRLGATRQQLRDELGRMWCWPGISRSRAAAAFADPGAATIGESVLRVLVAELDLGEIETQFEVTDGVRSTYADLRIGRHLFEFDGRVKYVDRARGGVADRPVHEVVWAEKRREDWMRRTNGGYGMSRVVWSEMFGVERRRTQRRLRAEFDETVRRLGPLAA